MGFDDLYENSHKQNSHSYEPYHGNEDSYHRSRSHQSAYDIKRLILDKIQDHPNMKIWILIALILIIGVIIIAGVLLLPLVLKIFNYVSQNGIQGIIDTLWKGSK